MKIKELGEKQLVEGVAGKLYSGKAILPAGVDDAGAVFFKGGKLVFSTDILFASTHFPKGMAWEEIGWKAAAANLSDLAAMGASPISFMASLGLPPLTPLKEWRRLMRGLDSCCRAHNTPFIGGDSKKAGELTVCGSVVGYCKGNLLLRRNARPGDVVALTGSIGSAACGLHALLKKKKAPSSLLKSFLHPSARLEEGIALSNLSRAACIDVTDGLIYSLNALSDASKVKLSVEKRLIPVSKQAKAFAEKHCLSECFLLDTGEDFELLACLPEKDFEKLKGRLGLKKIGFASKGRGVFVDGKASPSRGYDAFLR